MRHESEVSGLMSRVFKYPDMSIIKGLYIGKSAILAQMEAINTTGQNIANVNTPGYSRQRLEVKSMVYGDEDGLYILRACRIRDSFIDQRIWTENSSLGNWRMQTLMYGQVESVFLEPSEHDLNNALAEFWNSWEELATNPENMASRSTVVQSGMAVAQHINGLDSQLKSLREVADGYIEDRVSQINDIACRIADINAKLVAMEASGEEASEVRDSRDLLIDQMSELVDVTVLERENGQISLLIGGRAIVDGPEFTAIETQQSSNGGMMVSNIVWSNDGTSVRISGGELAGLLVMRDEVIPETLAGVDQLASTLINAVNAIHATGYGLDGSTGIDFFTGTGAFDIECNSEIVEDVRKVAASQNGEAGDNSIALAIAALANQDIAPNNTDIGTFYSDIVNTLGAQSRSASVMEESAGMFVTHIKEQRESISGVSLDEEAANLINFQRAYEAAAEYISVIDELIGTLIDMVRT